MTETVTIYRPGPQKRGGDRAPGTRHQLAGVTLAPRGASTEDTDQRNTVTVGLSMLCDDPAADVRAGDQVEYAGIIGAYHGTWDVTGEPGVWTGGHFEGGPVGAEVALVRVTG